MLKSYRDLKIWQEAHALTLAVYRLSADFPVSERFGITAQLRRAATSVGANITEGFSRIHRQEFVNFLSIARASAKEANYFLFLAGELGLTNKDSAGMLTERYNGLCAGIFALICSIKKRH